MATATDTDRLRAEYETLCTACGLLDRSERGKLALTGTGAIEFLNGQITQELADLHPGEGRYAAFLTNKGKMLGDLRVLAFGHDETVDELQLDTERVALQGLFDMIRRYKIGYDVELHKRTLERALLSLIGPTARACAQRASTDADAPAAPPAGLDARATPPAGFEARAASPAGLDTEHAHAAATIAARPVRLIVTAEGIDVLCDSADREAVHAALLEAGAREVCESAAEVLRVERGRPRYGLDMDDSTIPQEAALNERAVSFTKGCYVGQETVARLYYKGKPNRHLRGLRLSAPATTGEELRLGERVVGQLGSVVESPAQGWIALALVRREADIGDTLTVGEHGTAATLVDLPFASASTR